MLECFTSLLQHHEAKHCCSECEIGWFYLVGLGWVSLCDEIAPVWGDILREPMVHHRAVELSQCCYGCMEECMVEKFWGPMSWWPDGVLFAQRYENFPLEPRVGEGNVRVKIVSTGEMAGVWPVVTILLARSCFKDAPYVTLARPRATARLLNTAWHNPMCTISHVRLDVFIWASIVSLGFLSSYTAFWSWSHRKLWGVSTCRSLKTSLFWCGLWCLRAWLSKYALLWVVARLAYKIVNVQGLWSLLGQCPCSCLAAVPGISICCESRVRRVL